jgi:NTE family protein
LFQAVEVDGEHYWDGGYIGNPAIFPLIDNCANHDIVVVRISPFFRQEVPRSACAIHDRVVEISLNATLIREMGVIGFITQLIDGGRISGAALSDVRIHSISADEAAMQSPGDSSLYPNRQDLRRLQDIGRRHADAWLAANFDLVGRKSTIDFAKEFSRSGTSRAASRSAGELA